MGLRLVAHFFDRDEVLIAWSILDAADIPAFVHGLESIAMQPWYVGAFGGYRLLVSDLDLPDAVSLIRAAQLEPLQEGEALDILRYPVIGLAAIASFFMSGWIPWVPYRRHRWRPRER